jgi:hypothetical protein
MAPGRYGFERWTEPRLRSRASLRLSAWLRAWAMSRRPSSSATAKFATIWS